jgi:hypothetical protein
LRPPQPSVQKISKVIYRYLWIYLLYNYRYSRSIYLP